MSTELNIVERGLTQTSWDSSQGNLTTAQIAAIKEANTENSGALNALPTPFARMYVFAEAFRKVDAEEDEAGLAYKRLVSDCLDIFEILFNWQYHKNKNHRLSLKIWRPSDEIKKIKEKSPLLSKALDVYLKDATFQNVDAFHLLIYKNNYGKEFVLGGSSPFTFFVTTPSLDKDREGKFLNESYDTHIDIKKKKSGSYFRHVVLLKDRDVKFQLYMHHLFNGQNIQFAKEIRNYVDHATAGVDRNMELALSPIKDEDGSALLINGCELKSITDLSILNPFTDKLVKLPYRIDDTKYLCPTIDGAEDRKYDFLLPLSVNFLKSVDLNDISISADIKPDTTCPELIKVKFRLDIKGEVYKKIYYEKDIKSAGEGEYGEIIDLNKTHYVQFKMGIFPFVRTNQNKYNDYYKIGTYFGDNSSRRTLENEHVQCRFFKKTNNGYEEIREKQKDSSPKEGFKKCERTLISDSRPIGSNYFELFNTSFDIIELSLTVDENVTVNSLIIPLFPEINVGNQKFKVAVDLGTTNTFIAFVKEGADYKPLPLTITDEKRQMVMLHKPTTEKSDGDIDKYENEGSFQEAQDLIRSEFVPPLIGAHEDDFYHFPIRTALAVNEQLPRNPELFSHANIAFSYEKTPVQRWHRIDTDLKWNDNNENKIRIFLREILYLLRTQLLLDHGNPAATELIWFRPLSFTDSKKMLFTKIWKDEASKILRLDSVDLIKDYSESDAPYYYYKHAGIIKAISSVAVIDIGGGSTDYVIFKDNKPLIATSVNFGCDVLWGNGFSQFSDARENGIYKDSVEKVKSNVFDKSLRNLNADFIENPKVTTAEIINFWIANNDTTGILKLLENDKFKVMYLYHYVAILYHLMQVMKAKEMAPPCSIIFSGNGSKYIDLLATDKLLNKIAEEIILYVFQETKTIKVQLIIPEKNRKESTCFGGLYNETGEEASVIHFLGISSNKKENNLNKVAEIKNKYEIGDLKHSLIENICGFIDCFILVIYKLNLLKEINLNLNLDTLALHLEYSVEANLHKAYHNRVKGLNDAEELNDSMFFYPIINQLFELSLDNWNKAPISVCKQLFFKSKEELESNYSTEERQDSIYRLDQYDDGTAFLHVLNRENSMKTALINPEATLFPFCEYQNGYPPNDTKSYTQIRPGKLRKQGDRWEIERKAKINFD